MQNKTDKGTLLVSKSLPVANSNSVNRLFSARKKKCYDSYCTQVGYILHDINGKYIKGLEQMKIGAFDSLELQYSTMKEVSEYVKTKLKSEQVDRLKLLIKLISGFQSALSLEILASVAYVRKENTYIDLAQTITQIQNWSPRKKHLFKEKYIQIAYSYLEDFSKGRDCLFRTVK